MDPFSDVLNLLSARSYATAGLSAGNHWAMSFPGYNGLKFIFIKKGMFWFRLEAEPEWTQLSEGQGLVLTRYARFLMATDVNIPPAESSEKKGLALTRPSTMEVTKTCYWLERWKLILLLQIFCLTACRLFFILIRRPMTVLRCARLCRCSLGKR